MKNKKEDELLRSFFKSHTKEIEDNGFSEKVMQQIDKKREYNGRLWEVIGYGTCLLLFFLLDGTNAFINLVSKTYNFFQLMFKDTSLLTTMAAELNVTVILHILIVSGVFIGLLVEYLRNTTTTH